MVILNLKAKIGFNWQVAFLVQAGQRQGQGGEGEGQRWDTLFLPAPVFSSRG